MKDKPKSIKEIITVLQQHINNGVSVETELEDIKGFFLYQIIDIKRVYSEIEERPAVVAIIR